MSATLQRLYQIFASSLGISQSQISDSLEYNTIKEWNSLAHMALVSAIENEFELMLDTDDIINMSSVGKAKTILNKYGVEF